MNRKVQGEHIDYGEKFRSRNWEIYRQRKENGRTFTSLAKEHGVSIERIRSIVYRGDRMVRHRAALGMGPAY